MMVVRPCSRLDSSSLIASRKSMIPLLVSKKKKIAPTLKQLQNLLSKGLQTTAPLWPPLQRCYDLVHQATHILANDEQSPGAQVRERYLAHVSQMQHQKAQVGPRGEAIDHFAHITHNFAVGLFHCYKQFHRSLFFLFDHSACLLGYLWLLICSLVGLTQFPRRRLHHEIVALYR